MEDNGGRDITITKILADKLNFQFESIDPPEWDTKRTRGSRWGENFTFKGILGSLHYRKDPFQFYLGDTTQTYTRNSAVDFSFFTLADSGAFVTQAPRKITPWNLIIKPFSSN